ncbi:MAG: SDR family oxidoreductase [Acidimicrobiales bacterium]|nr:SDR family oxidoreductase [Acidimicrobiales bacterium]
MIVVVGASGVIGRAAAERFAAGGWDVVGVSRRSPDLPGVRHLPLDLTDPASCAAELGRLGEVTHLVYAAMSEAPGLVAGWRDRSLMEANLAMFANAMDPLVAAGELRHVSLLQGTKAYGVHLGAADVPVPVKERLPRHDHDNFYFLQEDHLRTLAERAGFAWTVWRPQVVYGRSFGSPMNLLPAIGAFAAITADLGEPLCFPGGADRVSEAIDAELLAEALDWATDHAAASNEVFNITNGDVFVWRHVWPAIAAALGVDAGPDRPRSLATEMPALADRWATIVDRHGLTSPRDLGAFVGDSFVYADMLFGFGQQASPMPVLSSTIKLRQAGFGSCLDTEDMFVRWFRRFREEGLLP